VWLMYVLPFSVLTFAINIGGYVREKFEISLPVGFNVEEGGEIVNAVLYVTTLHLNVRVSALPTDCRSVGISSHPPPSLIIPCAEPRSQLYNHLFYMQSR